MAAVLTLALSASCTQRAAPDNPEAPQPPSSTTDSWPSDAAFCLGITGIDGIADVDGCSTGPALCDISGFDPLAAGGGVCTGTPCPIWNDTIYVGTSSATSEELLRLEGTFPASASPAVADVLEWDDGTLSKAFSASWVSHTGIVYFLDSQSCESTGPVESGLLDCNVEVSDVDARIGSGRGVLQYRCE